MAPVNFVQCVCIDKAQKDIERQGTEGLVPSVCVSVLRGPFNAEATDSGSEFKTLFKGTLEWK